MLTKSSQLGFLLMPKFASTQINAIILAALGLLLVCIGIFMPQHRYYPVLEFSLTQPDAAIQSGELTTTMVMQPKETSQSCEQVTRTLELSLKDSCKACQAMKSSCEQHASDGLLSMISTRPVAAYVLTMPTGVVLYTSDYPAIAQLACQGSQAKASTLGIPTSCVPTIKASTELTKLLNQSSSGLSDPRIYLYLSVVFLLAALEQFLTPWFPVLAARALQLNRTQKSLVILASDYISLCLSLVISFLFLQASLLPSIDLFNTRVLAFEAFFPLAGLVIFKYFDLYNTLIRYAGLSAFTAIVKACVSYTLLLAASIYTLNLDELNLEVAVLSGLITLVLVGSSRALARILMASTIQSRSSHNAKRKRVAIYGAGDAGIQLATALAHSREMLPVLLVDDNASLQGQNIGGLKVASMHQLIQHIELGKVEAVLLALPSATRTRRNEIVASLEHLSVKVLTLPGLASLAEGKVKVSDLQDVEIEDLLGRDPVSPNDQLLQANTRHKSVMVTGAGGSIGSELCRQILAQQPSTLVLYELNEFALYAIEKELLNLNTANCHIVPILGSITDATKLAMCIQRFGTETIYHAAAYKHVPMVEKNPCSGAYNNIIGTWTTAQVALAHQVPTFVLISTDKAVRPTNIMGTTKRIAEMALQSLAQLPNISTRFVMVRFGNVLGSSGSVVPVFREQIKQGGPITVTDPRIIRYFMTIPEASQLVIQSGAMGAGGDVFVLDMGAPVKIVDLATRMIHLSGMSVRDNMHPDGDIEITFTGLRHGEKLYEELLIGSNVTATDHPRISRANEPTLSYEELLQTIDGIEQACRRNDSEKLREILLDKVSEFSPQCGNEDLLLNTSNFEQR